MNDESRRIYFGAPSGGKSVVLDLLAQQERNELFLRCVDWIVHRQIALTPRKQRHVLPSLTPVAVAAYLATY
jgi:hypothetical protein